MASNTSSEKQQTLSCYQCRARKLKCNRVWPCTRCLASGDECRFPTARQRANHPATRPRFKQLESRLHELEHRVKDAVPCPGPSHHNSGSSIIGDYAQPDSPSPASYATDLLYTGRFEQQPPRELVDELTNLYFLVVYPDAPMQHPGRFFASLRKPPQMQPPMCLQYIVLATGAMASQHHKELALPFYHRAKNYMHYDDMKDDGYLGMTVAHAQCWSLLSHFEARQLWFTRAPASVSRAVRLAQMLGLDNIDNDSTAMSRSVLPPAKDCAELEERRRTMWSIFCTDLDTSSTTGWPALLDPDKIHTFLPASDESFVNGVKEQSVSLRNALQDSSSQYSAYACRVLATLLFHECSSHTLQKYISGNENHHDLAAPFGVRTSDDFLATHRRLDDRLALMFMGLPDRIAHPSKVDGGPDASPIVLKLHTSVIAIHRSFRARVCAGQVGGIAGIPGAANSSLARMLISADEIHDLIISTTRDPMTNLSNVFVTFAAFMASFAYLEDFAEGQNHHGEQKLESLMDLLVAGADGNPISASLAVQLGHEMYRSNIDRSALGKVGHIIKKMDPNLTQTLMGKQDRQSGGTLYCPLARMAPSAS